MRARGAGWRFKLTFDRSSFRFKKKNAAKNLPEREVSKISEENLEKKNKKLTCWNVAG